MRDRYLKYIRQKPGCTVKPSEDEPDSSGKAFMVLLVHLLCMEQDSIFGSLAQPTAVELYLT